VDCVLFNAHHKPRAEAPEHALHIKHFKYMRILCSASCTFIIMGCIFVPHTPQCAHSPTYLRDLLAPWYCTHHSWSIGSQSCWQDLNLLSTPHLPRRNWRKPIRCWI